MGFLDLCARPDPSPDLGQDSLGCDDPNKFVSFVRNLRQLTGTLEQSVGSTSCPSTNCTVVVNQNSDAGLNAATLTIYAYCRGVKANVTTFTLATPADSTPRKYTFSSAPAEYYEATVTPVASMAVQGVFIVIGNGEEDAATAGNITLAGDVTGAASANTVVAIQGKSVSTTTPTNNQALIWNNGTSKWTPTAIAGATTLAGDVTGLANNNKVSAISGTTPIAITPNELQWIAGAAAPLLDQAISTTGAGVALTIGSQAAKVGSAANGGNLVLKSGALDGAGENGAITFSPGGTRRAYFAQSTPASQFYLTFDASLTGNVGVSQDQANNGVSGTEFDISSQSGGAVSGNTNGGIIQILSGNAGFGNGVGGNINLFPGSSLGTGAAAAVVVKLTAPPGAGAEGYFVIQRGGSNRVQAGALVGTLTTGAIYLSAVTAASTNYIVAGNSTDGLFNATTTTLRLQIAAVDQLTMTTSVFNLTPATVQWVGAAVTPQMTQAAPAAGVNGTTLSITSQSGGGTSGNTLGGPLTLTGGAAGFGNAAGGNVNLVPGASLGTAAAAAVVANIGAPPGAGAEGYFVIQRGGSNRVQAGALVGTLTTGAIYLSAVTAASTNYIVAGNSTDGLFNATTTTLRLQVAAVDQVTLTTSILTVIPATVQFDDSTVAPTILQQTQDADAATANLTVQAQSALSSAASNINGGILVLQGGAAKTNGTTGLRGGVRLELGADTGEVMIEAAEVAVGQRVASLCQLGTGITSTQVPANAGDGVAFLWNAATAPTTGTPVGGALIWAAGGACKAKGTSGTVTTFAPAELEGFKATSGKGHCPSCGTDFAHEWENERYGSLTICMRCLADELGDRPWIVRKKAA